jgi:ERCC4-type nuclease
MVKFITLDTRESNSTFVSLLADKARENGFDVVMRALPVGDIQFENIIIERKEANDFCSSVCSTRLWEQAYKMKENKDYTFIIIISGGWDTLWKDSIDNIPALEGAIVQLYAWNIPVLRVDDDEKLVDAALKIFEHSKPIDIPIKHVVKNKKDSMFMALPGVGRTLGKVLMKKYDNMCALCEASAGDLKKILGPKKGQVVFDTLRE